MTASSDTGEARKEMYPTQVIPPGGMRHAACMNGCQWPALAAKIETLTRERDALKQDVEQLEEAHETLTKQQAEFLRTRHLMDNVIEAAKDHVALWAAQKASDLSRAERNASIEHSREKLIAATVELAP